MTFSSVSSSLILSCTIMIWGQSQAQDEALPSLVQAEHDFAKASVTKGLKQAFLSYLADSAIVFRPHPVNAKHWYEQIEETSSILNWHPVYADIAQSGDFGYTTGPWEMTDNSPRNRPPSYGHYFSVWKKEEAGDWKVVVDLGIRHPAPEQKAGESWQTSTRTRAIEDHPLQASELQIERKALLETERAFSKLSETSGYVEALQNYSIDEARWYRPNHRPLVGKKAVQEFMQPRKGTMMWRNLQADLAPSADLAYTVGLYEFTGEDVAPDKGYYVRMWKKMGSSVWRMVLEVISPISSAQ